MPTHARVTPEGPLFTVSIPRAPGTSSASSPLAPSVAATESPESTPGTDVIKLYFVQVELTLWLVKIVRR